MLKDVDLRAALGKVPIDGLVGPFHRYIWFRHLREAPFSVPTILSGELSRRAGGRYTPRGSFRTIYLTTDPVTGLREIEARFQGAVSPPEVHCTIIGQLHALLNLLDDSTLKILRLDAADLLSPWELLEVMGVDPPTHILARAMYDSGLFEGIIYPSAQAPDGACVAVFPDRFHASSWLEVDDPSGLLSERIEGGGS